MIASFINTFCHNDKMCAEDDCIIFKSGFFLNHFKNDVSKRGELKKLLRVCEMCINSIELELNLRSLRGGCSSQA